MKNCFILIEEQGLYKLYFKPTGYCLSSTSNYSAVIKTLRRLVKKYKTPERLAKALRHLEDKGEVAPKTYDLWLKQVENGDGQLYAHLLREEVGKVIEEMKSDTPLGKLQKRKKKLGHTISPLETTDKTPLKKKESTKTVGSMTKGKGLLKKKHLLSIGD